MSDDGDALLGSRIEDLRRRGAARVDAVRLVQLEALARRIAGQPEPVRALLRGRADAALAELERRLAPDSAAPVEPSPIRVRRTAGPAPRARSEPLARLNDAIRDAAARQQRGAGDDELASVRRFRRAWSGTRAQERVLQAASQKPSNAGPLNSQVLVLQSLELMRQLPGDYLRRFVGHVEALLWLEAAGAQAAGKPKRQRR